MKAVHQATEELQALFPKHPTYFGGNELSNMMNISVSAVSRVGERKFNRKWLMLSAHYLFHPKRARQLALTS
jgi:hypothetical protein